MEETDEEEEEEEDEAETEEKLREAIQQHKSYWAIFWVNFWAILGHFWTIFDLDSTVETGYKVTAYKVKSDIKLSFHSHKVPFQGKLWSVIR